jgi:hypothetical protein
MLIGEIGTHKTRLAPSGKGFYSRRRSENATASSEVVWGQNVVVEKKVDDCSYCHTHQWAAPEKTNRVNHALQLQNRGKQT